jgi:hypothetical protein
VIPHNRSPHPTHKKSGEQKGKIGQEGNKENPIELHGFSSNSLFDLEKAKEDGQLHIHVKK